MNPRLRVIAGPLKDNVVELPAGEITVGRVASNLIAISDPALSRHHCRLLLEDGRYRIQDLKSRNGTQVNGIAITEHWLRHGDRIAVGDSLLLFLTQEEETPEQAGVVEFDDDNLPMQATVHLRPEDAVYLHPPHTTEEDSLSAALTRNLNALLKISQSVHSIHDPRELQEQVLQSIFEVAPAEDGAILLDRGGEFTSTLARDRHGSEAPVRVSRTIVQQVMKQGVAMLLNDIPNQDGYGAVKSLVASEVRSLLCVPLHGMNRVIGCIYLSTRKSGVPFTEDQLHLVTALAAIASVALENVHQLEWLRQENRRLNTEINLDHDMKGDSPAMREVLQVLERVAPTETTVLIRGESGTGKELAARAIHKNSRRGRAEKPFVAINCAALTETLLESELFGHEKGAFTGAVAQKKGKLEVANGGTVFLDEIGELPPGPQAKLLRVLQERELERVGGNRAIPVDIRLLAATNRNLEEAMKAGHFRQDLYFRLNVVALTMPPLRDHKQDIPQLAAYFVAKHSARCNRPGKPIAEAARACLMSYDWPGNVRELENAIERAVVLSVGDTLMLEDLPEQILDLNPSPDFSSAKYHGAVQDLKKKLILSAIKESNGNYTDAAKALGLHPNYLHRLIRNLNLKSSI
jgi:transcriptional regulator with GAF, ATPase, and Fis domain